MPINRKDSLSLSKNLMQAISNLIDKRVEEKTKDCIRAYKCTVVSAPQSLTGTCVVRIAGSAKTLTIPYSSQAANVTVGNSAWIIVLYNDFRNAILWHKWDFSDAQN